MMMHVGKEKKPSPAASTLGTMQPCPAFISIFIFISLSFSLGGLILLFTDY